jgi:hypothetical protein
MKKLFTALLLLAFNAAIEPAPRAAEPVATDEARRMQAASDAIKKTLVQLPQLPNVQDTVPGGCRLTQEYADMVVKAARLLTNERPGWTLQINSCWWSYVDYQRLVQKGSKGKYNPKVGHYAGTAVDLRPVGPDGVRIALPNMRVGQQPVSMNEEERANKTYLANLMTRAGWHPLASEWWHFDEGSHAKEAKPDTPPGK